MTRINCIPPQELTSKHLLAEYRELPRVFGLARLTPDIPASYTMGRGHVLFFYNKLTYLANRHASLVAEMKHRGFTVNFPSPPQSNHAELYNDWVPTPEAMAINRHRIAERLNKIPTVANAP